MIIFIYLAFVLGCRRQARKACSLPFFAVLCAFLLSKSHFAPVLYFSGRPPKNRTVCFPPSMFLHSAILQSENCCLDKKTPSAENNSSFSPFLFRQSEAEEQFSQGRGNAHGIVFRKDWQSSTKWSRVNCKTREGFVGCPSQL